MGEKRFTKTVRRKQKKKLKSRTLDRSGIWYGLGMFGMVGWSIAIPTAAGGLLGLWLDSAYPIRGSWALSLIIGGLGLGCVHAWQWMKHERNKIETPPEDDT